MARLHTLKIYGDSDARPSEVVAFSTAFDAGCFAHECKTHGVAYSIGFACNGWPEFKRYAENVVCPCGMAVRFERQQQRSVMWTEFGRRGRAVFIEKDGAK